MQCTKIEEQEMNQRMNLSPSAVIDCHAAMAAIRTGDYEMATRCLKRAVRAAVGNPQVWSKLMLALREVRKAARQTIQ